MAAEIKKEKKDTLNENERKQYNIDEFQPYLARNATITNSESLHTISGKPLIDPVRTDIYIHNSTPPLSILSKYNSQSFTDDEGRIYWACQDIKDFRWERLDEIQKSMEFDPYNDIVFYVRPQKGAAEQFTLPQKDMSHPMYFYQHTLDQGQGRYVVYSAYVKDTGEDELRSASATPSRTQRKTSYVILHRFKLNGNSRSVVQSF
jgi:hypothetical protein